MLIALYEIYGDFIALVTCLFPCRSFRTYTSSPCSWIRLTTNQSLLLTKRLNIETVFPAQDSASRRDAINVYKLLCNKIWNYVQCDILQEWIVDRGWLNHWILVYRLWVFFMSEVLHTTINGPQHTRSSHMDFRLLHSKYSLRKYRCNVL
jgi:hypothetical protein